MKSLLIAAAALLCAGGFSAFAQTGMTPVTANHLKVSGVPIANGVATFTVVSANDSSSVVPYTDGTGSLNAPYGFGFQITNGALPSNAVVPDLCLSTATTPNTPLAYKVQVVAPAQSVQYTIFPVTGVCGTNTFALDHYAALQSTTVSPAGLIASTTVPTKCVSPSLYENTSTSTLYMAGPGNSCVAITGSTGAGTATATFALNDTAQTATFQVVSTGGNLVVSQITYNSSTATSQTFTDTVSGTHILTIANGQLVVN